MTAQDAPKTVQEGPESPNDRSKTPKIASRWRNGFPRRPKRPSRGIPRRPLKAKIADLPRGFEGLWRSRLFGLPTLQDGPKEAPKTTPKQPTRPPRVPQDILRAP
eukprot:3016267-Pyramimonas_sp.AAC.1